MPLPEALGHGKRARDQGNAVGFVQMLPGTSHILSHLFFHCDCPRASPAMLQVYSTGCKISSRPNLLFSYYVDALTLFFYRQKSIGIVDAGGSEWAFAPLSHPSDFRKFAVMHRVALEYRRRHNS